MTRPISPGVALSVAMLVSLAGCDKPRPNPSTSAPASQNAPAIPAAVPEDHDDESAALRISNFASGIVWHFNIDGFDAAQRLAAMNGVDNRSTYGAVYEQHSGGCPTTPADQSFALRTEPYLQIDAGMAASWLKKEGFIETRAFTVTYPNAQMASSYGAQNTFYCAYFTDRFAQLFGGHDLHHGFAINFVRRVFDRWTFENRYEADFPGKGKVSIFAGSFAYHFESVLPGVSSGTGSASVKLYKDPDTGQWTVLNYTATEPTITFETQ